MLPYLREHFGNPSSRHLYGRRTHDAIERARSDVAALINSHADEIIFTSGGTEANNLAIRGTTARTSRRRVVTSTVEHPATARPVTWLEQHGWDVIRIGVDAGGRARVPEIDAAALLAATPQIAASTGSACHDGDESASAVLLAMGIPAKVALGSVRLTLGRATTDSAVDRAAAALARAWRTLVIE
jgi:cysteine desulfurase